MGSEKDKLVLCVRSNENLRYVRDQNLHCWLPRSDAEENRCFRQLIPYCIVRRSDGKTLRYSRNGSEGRLHGFKSIGIGGHVEYPETFESGMAREIEEEIGVSVGDCTVTFLGTICLNQTAVDAVHLGLAFIVYTDDAVPGDELHHPEWVDLGQLDDERDDLESWSLQALSLERSCE